MKKSVTTLYTWAFILGLIFLTGWCTRFCSTPKIITLTTLDLEPTVVDTIIHTSDQHYSNFLRLRFKSLKDVKLDYRKYEMGTLDDYGMEIKIQLKSGKMLESEFDLHGLQEEDELVLRGADFGKRWHSWEEREEFDNLSIETVSSIYIRIYEEDGSEFPTVTAKRFSNFGTISSEEGEDYNYAYHQY